MVALLQYVANQLKSSESLDLLVLKEMVQTMTVRGGGAVGRQRGGWGVGLEGGCNAACQQWCGAS